VVDTLSNARAPSSPLLSTSIVWGDRVFQTPPDLTRWLHARGATYTAWSANHLRAAALLEHRLPVPRRKLGGAATTTAAAGSGARRSAKHSSSGGVHLKTVLVTLLALLALTCVLLASLPEFFGYRLPRLTRRIAPHRDVFLAGAAALIIGILAGVALN
jgi:hypothetical protein